jgi:methylmalonyl-CoA mutase N-terminal domain/subunit
MNNIVRVTIQALTAILGGTQSLHTNSYDEALSLPEESSALLALRTQQILAEESGVTEAIDPLGGSYLVEELTDEIERSATEYIRKIDEMGGMLKAVEKEFPQSEIHKMAYEWQKEVDQGRRRIVGVNCFKESEPEIQKYFRHSPEAEKVQKERLEDYIRNRRKFLPSFSEQTLTKSFDALKRSCESTEGICEAIVNCVRAGATEGEIVDAMAQVWGRYEGFRSF